jgi:hypothetical protein
MARGKFNKRGGGPRLDAQNAEEIEIRNARLAELEEQRQVSELYANDPVKRKPRSLSSLHIFIPTLYT